MTQSNPNPYPELRKLAAYFLDFPLKRLSGQGFVALLDRQEVTDDGVCQTYNAVYLAILESGQAYLGKGRFPKSAMQGCASGFLDQAIKAVASAMFTPAMGDVKPLWSSDIPRLLQDFGFVPDPELGKYLLQFNNLSSAHLAQLHIELCGLEAKAGASMPPVRGSLRPSTHLLPPTAPASKIDLGDLPLVIGKSGLMIPLGQDLYHNKDGSQMAQSIFMHLQPLSASDGMSIGVEFYHDFNEPEADPSAAGSIDAVRAQDLLNAIEAGETPPYPNKFDAKQAMASIMAMGDESYKFVQSLLHAPDPARLAWMKKYLPQIAGGAENENSGAELVRRIAEQIRQQDWPIRTTRARPDCAVIHLGWLESKGGEEIAYYTRFLGIDGKGRCAGFLLPVPPGARDEATSASMEVMLKFLSTSRPRPRPEGLEIFDPRIFYEKICSWAQIPQQPAQERIVRTILSMDDKARRGVVFHLIDEMLNGGQAKSRKPTRTLPSQEHVR